MDNLKQCKICEEWLPATTEYFYRNNSNKKDGLNTYCKECTKKKTHKWQEENVEYYLEKHTERQSEYRKRNEVKIRKKEIVRKLREQGYFKKYYHDNQEQFKNYRENYTHKKHDITNEEWVFCKNYFNNTCAYCGIREEDAKEQQGQFLHKEHAINDGANDLSNCIPSCKICNSTKSNKDYKEWFNESNENYSNEKEIKIDKWLNEDYLIYKKN